jgi:dolichol-phosphate mannosyltransferase
LGIVTPLANEEDTIDEFLKRVLVYLEKDDRIFCVIDKVCKDSTRAKVDAAAAADPRIVPVWSPENRCVVDAYFRGYRAALEHNCRWILEMDGGLSHVPEQIPRFLEKMEAGFDYAAGCRFGYGGKFHGKLSRWFVSWGGTIAANTLLGTHMKDMCSGFECFTNKALSHVVAHGVLSRANFFQTEIRFILRDWNWVEVPITYYGPPKGVPKSSVKEAFRILFTLRKSRNKQPEEKPVAADVNSGTRVG